jgi:hypothetical protein
MEIPDIRTTGIGIPDIPPVVDYGSNPAQLFTGPPVVVNIGVPVVDIPGCVEAHGSNGKSKTLGSDDSRGLVTYCDSGVPSFNPIQYEPNQMIMTRPSGVDTRQPKTPSAPELPIPKTPPSDTAKIDCPTAAQEAKEPVGTYVEGFRKKVTEYKLIGNECVQITEAVPIPQQIVAGLPAPGVVTMTATIAVVATASALMAKPLTDVLLKVIKPMVKKVMKKIAAIRGKTVPVLSTAERRNEQRDRNRAIMALRQTLKPR